ncbi:hypothetical protein [Methylobacterium frigidaeris]|uniref:Uncharacterized protein n=1 Tax=Methylobacterium frigidaeris TaxID=2038277 RepID=A0AA37M5T3_9HYPH|nr:hypothetical protein [Methylobacterium frigidaeris]GJD63772.1 hypothetical protein MPEAHAMD_3943 [Methylobacterium frigidaeris]
MSVAFRRPKLTHMPHQVFARQERESTRLEEISRHEEHTCAICGVFGASFGFKPPGWAHNRAEAVWACSDADCRTAAQARVARGQGPV